MRCNCLVLSNRFDGANDINTGAVAPKFIAKFNGIPLFTSTFKGNAQCVVVAAVVERTADGGYTGGNCNVTQTGAKRERTTADGGYTIGNYDCRQSRTTAKYAVLNGGYTIGNCNTRQVRTPTKRTTTDDGYAIGNINVR